MCGVSHVRKETTEGGGLLLGFHVGHRLAISEPAAHGSSFQVRGPKLNLWVTHLRGNSPNEGHIFLFKAPGAAFFLAPWVLLPLSSVWPLL